MIQVFNDLTRNMNVLLQTETKIEMEGWMDHCQAQAVAKKRS